MSFKLDNISVANVFRNLSPAELYEEALRRETGSAITSSGALAIRSGAKTGRSPKDKRIVDHPDSTNDINWGNVNVKLDKLNFNINLERAIDYINTRDRVYIVDAYAGWDDEHKLKVRVICTRAYHALFMWNMLRRPTTEELANFGEPDFTIYNAGRFPCNRYTAQMTSTTSVALSFEDKALVILGTEYAGEMKKGIFSLMNYLMPKKGVMSMHCSANESKEGDTSIFFGLSGTGKTTLSADPRRLLIGDDEHCWTDKGVFNIEGGCYAKCIDLSAEKEPEIFGAIRFGSILENVVFDTQSRDVDYTDKSLTENTRASYPIEFIPNAKIPCVGNHPKHVIFLTCDAFGVLPPVSRLSPSQAMYHFISGYTAKVAGTEQGVTEPEATFSACFGAAFMVLHPARYAELLAEKIKKHGSQAWLINTGWTGGAYGTGERMKLKYTRAIIDAIHNGTLQNVETQVDPVFGLAVPQECPGVPTELLNPRNTWKNQQGYDDKAKKLAGLFHNNFSKYESAASDEIKKAGPVYKA